MISGDKCEPAGDSDSEPDSPAEADPDPLAAGPYKQRAYLPTHHDVRLGACAGVLVLVVGVLVLVVPSHRAMYFNHLDSNHEEHPPTHHWQPSGTLVHPI